MLKKVATYFHFLLRSSNQHGIHSPFVYDFVTKALYPKYKGNGYAIFKNNKKALFQNHTLITVQDFGAGSKVFKTNHRKISSIARVAGISNKRGLLLLKTLHYFKPKSVLEIGTSLGIATTALSITNKDISVTTLEGCTNTAAVAKDRFAKMDLENIDLKVGHFNDSLKNVTKNTSYDLIFFDGNHTKEATLTYFKECLVTIQNDTV
jgi:predicted O-methyltransferase YrrM